MKTTKYFFLLLSLQFLISCHMDGQNWYKSGIKGQGPKVTETLDLPAFDAISLNISGNVYLRQGNTQSVKIEAQQNVLDQIVREVSGNHWKIKFDQNVRNHDAVKIWITMPTLTEACISGSGDIIGESAFKGLGDLTVGISGSGNIDLEVEAKNLNSGISGSGDIRAFNLACRTADINIPGSGDCEVFVSEFLKVRISGSGDVFFKGNPDLDVSISGSGNVIDAN